MYAIKSVLLGVSALAAFVAAQSQLYFTQTPPQAVPGTTYQIKYHAPSGAPVTINLRNGPSGNLNTVATLTSTASGGVYPWTPSSSLVSGTYALSISQPGSDPNYSGEFQLTGGAASSSSAVSSTAASSSLATSSAPYGSSQTVTSSVASRILPSSNLSMTYTPSSVASPTVAGVLPGSTGSGGGTMYGSNQTFSAPSGPSATGGSGGSSPTAAATSAKPNGGATLGSSMALVFGAVAAFAFLN